MPTNGNQVKFQYIGTTSPSSYNSDTIYFDNINKQIKVGSTVISDQTPSNVLTDINYGDYGIIDSSNIIFQGSNIQTALENINGSYPLIIDGTGETGDTVYFTKGNFQYFGALYPSAAKAIFVFAIPRVADPSYINDFDFLAEAHVGKIDWTNYTIEMNGIGDSKLYSVTLANVPGQYQMTGTLTVKGIGLDVIDEEEF